MYAIVEQAACPEGFNLFCCLVNEWCLVIRPAPGDCDYPSLSLSLLRPLITPGISVVLLHFTITPHLLSTFPQIKGEAETLERDMEVHFLSYIPFIFTSHLPLSLFLLSTYLAYLVLSLSLLSIFLAFLFSLSLFYPPFKPPCSLSLFFFYPPFFIHLALFTLSFYLSSLLPIFLAFLLSHLLFLLACSPIQSSSCSPSLSLSHLYF